MSSFKLPKGIIGDLEKLAAKFWWRKSFDSFNIHWLSWKRLTCSESLGGLGFKELNLFNAALLAKQAWQVIKNPEALWVRVLKGVYFSFSDFLRACKGNNCSWGWKSLLEGREALSKGLRWNVVGPSFLDAWNEPWIPSLPSFKIQSARPPDSPVIYLANLINSATSDWDQAILYASFSLQECAAILKIPLSSINREPNLVWHFSQSGIPPVKSIYFILKKDLSTAGPSSSQAISPQMWNSIGS
ncbi:uncharacterized mitochondrial protein AtMg00310-like [Hevea brasiliensis]|uniref:uncharacterized mitochondrial protein AtMg00310-like n=1 Tax=Hevea brasiliensis TaxID=3981 RepID=UPI0025F28EAF|nr:uncharacterized mitochondrial protein AtMg00310-like [Hevea brasiliensis]